VLIALYHLPEHDALGYTHAYFPLYSFDETQLRAGWAFARKGDGYVALRASQEFTLITQGEQAYRELRAPGQHHVWLCHMGQAASDGSFANFQEKILALPVGRCRSTEPASPSPALSTMTASMVKLNCLRGT
jgi:hypothetical protein